MTAQLTRDGYPARCYDCLSYDVAVKAVGPLPWQEHWFCAADWAAQEALAAKIQAMLRDAEVPGG